MNIIFKYHHGMKFIRVDPYLSAKGHTFSCSGVEHWLWIENLMLHCRIVHGNPYVQELIIQYGFLAQV